MFLYVRKQDGSFIVVHKDKIPNIDIKNIDKFKKYKIVIDGEEPSDILIIYYADTRDELEKKIQKGRPSIPPLCLQQSASEIDEQDNSLKKKKEEEEASGKKKNKINDLLNKKLSALTDLQEENIKVSDGDIVLNVKETPALFDSNSVEQFSSYPIDKSDSSIVLNSTMSTTTSITENIVEENSKEGVSNGNSYINPDCPADDVSHSVNNDNTPSSNNNNNEHVDSHNTKRSLKRKTILENANANVKLKNKKSKKLKTNDKETLLSKYKSEIKSKDEEISKLRKLNEELQMKILSKIDEYASRQINPFAICGLSDVALGHINPDTNKIYCGNDFYMCRDRYLDAVNKASSCQPNREYSSFVKNCALTIFGFETLKNSSVKGRKCNRIKDSVPKEPLDPVKLKALHGIFEYYLSAVKKLDPVEIQLELKEVSAYVASKIQDLNRKPRIKNSNSASTSALNITINNINSNAQDKERPPITDSSAEISSEDECTSSSTEDEEEEILSLN